MGWGFALAWGGSSGAQPRRRGREKRRGDERECFSVLESLGAVTRRGSERRGGDGEMKRDGNEDGLAGPVCQSHVIGHGHSFKMVL